MKLEGGEDKRACSICTGNRKSSSGTFVSTDLQSYDSEKKKRGAKVWLTRNTLGMPVTPVAPPFQLCGVDSERSSRQLGRFDLARSVYGSGVLIP